MLRTKGGFISKPSKASLKSRGLSSNALRPGSNASSVDGRYSLYSIDSEDNAVGVYKGLDRCAQLLTNILEVNVEKDISTQKHPHSKICHKKVIHKSKKPPTSHFKADINKMKGLKPKRKQRAVVHIPTTKPESNEVQYNKPSYNEKVVASTPVLTTDERKQQELQQRENILQQQIDLLQEQYENLQKDTVGSPDSEKPSDDVSQLLPKNNEESCEVSHENRSARKSLEFTTNAEKPFIDNKNMTSSTNNNNNVLINENTLKPNETKKKVRIAQQDIFLRQETNENTCGTGKYYKPGHHERYLEKNQSDRHDVVVGVPRQREKEDSNTKTGQHGTPQKNTDHLRILIYLVGELKSVLENSEDVEVERLLMEIENEIRLLSYPMQSPVVATSGGKTATSGGKTATSGGKTGKQHDIDTEVALQPLRCENSDLRRKLRIANQRLRETESRQSQENTRQKPPSEGLIDSLHNQILEERKKFGKLMQQMELAEKKLSEHIQERKRSQVILSEKEEEIVNINEELRRQREKTKAVVSQMKVELESNTISLRAKDKEVAMLNIALKQRDTEIERLTELTRGLQQSLTKVLTNVQGLHPDDVISEMSSLHSFLDTWQPRELKAADLSFAPSSNESHHQLDNHEYHQAREYDKQNICGPTVYNRGNYGQLVYGKGSPEVQDNMSLLSSSELEESTFKQELANLDTAIARLQDNLRGKL